MGLPDHSDSQESTCSVGDLGSISGLGRSSGKGNGNPLQYSCLENPHGQRSLAGYSPWGHKESDRTGRLSTHTYVWSKVLEPHPTGCSGLQVDREAVFRYSRVGRWGEAVEGMGVGGWRWRDRNCQFWGNQSQVDSLVTNEISRGAHPSRPVW